MSTTDDAIRPSSDEIRIKLKESTPSNYTNEKAPSANIENDQNKKRKSASPSILNKESKRIKSENDDYPGTYYGSTLSDAFNNYHVEIPEEESYEEIAKQYKKYTNAPKFNLNSEEIFCICRKPDYGGEMMISCDSCDEWFHFKCMNLNEKHAKLIAKFFCKFCRWKGINSTKWKRKCRLDWCSEPVRADSKSKYCCDEHGVTFMKENLLNRRGISDLKTSEIKSILSYCTKNDCNHEVLIKLGLIFPELPEILALKENDFDVLKFPNDLKNYLFKINENLNKINSFIDLCKQKSSHLLKVKEKIKLINDRLTSSFQDDDNSNDDESFVSKKSKAKPKNKRPKKFDLCSYDKTLNHGLQNVVSEKITSADVYDEYKSQIDGLIEFYHDHKDEIDTNPWFDDIICIQDKRKCPRHNGWWNLINDEIIKKFNELSLTSKSLEDERVTLLREYSIKIYERKV